MSKRGKEQLNAMAWPPNELHKIAKTDDVHISPFRDDGITHGTPTWIWSVVVDDGLYVRAYNWTDSRGIAPRCRQRAGRIAAGGMTKDVHVEPVHGPINDRIDDAYRTKYHGSPYLQHTIGPGARSATIRVTPGKTNS